MPETISVSLTESDSHDADQDVCDMALPSAVVYSSEEKLPEEDLLRRVKGS